MEAPNYTPSAPIEEMVEFAIGMMRPVPEWRLPGMGITDALDATVERYGLTDDETGRGFVRAFYDAIGVVTEIRA